MASQNLKTGGTMLMFPGVLIGIHGVMYAMFTLMVGLMGLGLSGLLFVGALEDGSSEGWLAFGMVGGLAGMGTLFTLLFAVVHLVLGGVVIRGVVRALKGGGKASSLLPLAVISAVFCAAWTAVAMLAFNPFFVLWAVASVLSVVAAVTVSTEPRARTAAI